MTIACMTRINKVGSRHSIYLRKSLVEDSGFPFVPGELLLVRIEGRRLIIERPVKRKRTKRMKRSRS